MSKKRLILSSIFLLAIVSVSCLSVSSVNTNSVVVKEQSNDIIEVSLNPKSSGYAITSQWNLTTGENVNSVAVSADGRYMVIGTAKVDGTGEKYNELFLKKTSNNQTIWVYNITTDDINSVAISKYGDYIVCGCEDAGSGYTIYSFNNLIPVGDKEPRWKYYTSQSVSTIDISADGEFIVAECGSSVYLFNNSIPVGEKYPHWQKDLSLWNLEAAISSDGNYIVVGAFTNNPVHNGEVLFFNNSFHPGTDKPPEWKVTTGIHVYSVAISGKGEYVAAGCTKDLDSYKLLVFNKTGNLDWFYDYGERIFIYSVAISADGEYIVTGEELAFWDGKVSLFSNSKQQREWTSSLEGKVLTVDMTADGKYIVAGTMYEPNVGSWRENTIFLYNNTANPIDNALPEWAFNTSDDVNSMSISAWGNYIGAGGDLATIGGNAFCFYHARPIPTSIVWLLGDDDDDDDDEEIIPFGNYYLVFAVLAIAALIIIYKRKLIFNKR